MCMGGGNDAAAEARRQEEARQRKISQGRERINSAFGSFNDQYYSGIQDDYTSYYMPKIEEQYNDARQDLTMGLARSGNLQSSAGANQLADLEEAFAKQQAYYTDQARAYVSDARGRVGSAKDSLFSQLNASADPQSAAQSANARAEALSQPPAFSPMGDLFSKFANQASNAVAAERSGYKGYGLGVKPPSLKSSGNGRVVS